MRLVASPVHRPDGLHLLPGGSPDDLVDSRSSLPFVGNHPKHRQEPRGHCAGENVLEEGDLTPAFLPCSLGNTHLQPMNLAAELVPLDGVPVLPPCRDCTGVWQSQRLYLPSPFPHRIYTLSCQERPVGRGLTFVPGNVKTRVRPVTGRHSLLPTSQARTSHRSPCGSPALAGGDTGLPRSASEVCAGLGTCCRPGSTIDHEMAPLNPPPASSPFGLSLSATLARRH